MYRFEVKLVLKSGKIIQGNALQTAYSKGKEECLLLETGEGTETVILEHLARMEAVTKNPHFEIIKFT